MNTGAGSVPPFNYILAIDATPKYERLKRTDLGIGLGVLVLVGIGDVFQIVVEDVLRNWLHCASVDRDFRR